MREFSEWSACGMIGVLNHLRGGLMHSGHTHPPEENRAILVPFEDAQITLKTRNVHASHDVYS